jgi:predicted dithiol-disulfide oxidoreductase (DUF899 family)
MSHSSRFRVSFTKEEVAKGKIDYTTALLGFRARRCPASVFFYKDDAGEIFHTYSTFGRGDEMVDTSYMYLDLTPKGRNETGPHFNLGDWVRHHDRYGVACVVDAGGRFLTAQPAESSGRCADERA